MIWVGGSLSYLFLMYLTVSKVASSFTRSSRICKYASFITNTLLSVVILIQKSAVYASSSDGRG